MFVPHAHVACDRICGSLKRFVACCLNPRTWTEAAVMASNENAPCAHCSKVGAPVRCSQCKCVYYCDRECQRQHWKSHKRACKEKASGSASGAAAPLSGAAASARAEPAQPSPVSAAGAGIGAVAGEKPSAAAVALPQDLLDIADAAWALEAEENFAEAVDKYGEAIKALEARVGDEPEGAEDRRSLALLCTMRATANLRAIWKAREVNKQSGADPELRRRAMRANVDSSRAAEADTQNAEAWLRKGQAALGMSATQQRSKDAFWCMQKAAGMPSLPAHLQHEVSQWLSISRKTLDSQTEMPPGCPQA
mmetsp:Transcript_175407/g.557017  ORF Transcript_175407/g.557017 Transcript_175407/m.557017 type:complete len:308 (+) Transcript_175407:52-975(+)